jgi:putative endonuclease
MEILGWMYILTNKHNKVLYTGSTNNLPTRCWEHKTKQDPKCFTARYNVDKLVYYEEFPEHEEAKAREKVVKRKTRAYKIQLINSKNPEWRDLYDDVRNSD